MAIRSQPVLILNRDFDNLLSSKNNFKIGVAYILSDRDVSTFQFDYKPPRLSPDSANGTGVGPGLVFADAQFKLDTVTAGVVTSGTLTFHAQHSFDEINFKWNVFDAASLATFTSIDGTGQADIIMGTVQGDIIRGLDGNDIIETGGGGGEALGGKGNDIYYAHDGDQIFERSGEGSDAVVAASKSFKLQSGQEIEVLAATPFYEIFLPPPSGFRGFSRELPPGASTLVGNEFGQKIYGGGNANTLMGQGGSDALAGFNGDDILSGGAGNDTIDGGDGNDKLSGDSGKDTFFFNAKPVSTNVDRIADFKPADDTIQLNHFFFSEISGKGTLSKSQFKDITDPHTKLDGNDHILYNHVNGRLYYDPDGSGHDSRMPITSLDKHPVLTASDFLLV